VNEPLYPLPSLKLWWKSFQAGYHKRRLNLGYNLSRWWWFVDLMLILFSPLGKPSVISFFYYKQSHLSIYWTDFHDLFTKWKAFAWIFLIWSSFSNSSRDVAIATNLVAKMGQNYLPPALIALSFRNGMAYRLANTRINSSTNCSTSCEKMVKIGSVVFELKWGRKWKLSCKWPKLAYIAEYLNNYWTRLYLCFSICRCIYADYKTDISFTVVQGTLLW